MSVVDRIKLWVRANWHYVVACGVIVAALLGFLLFKRRPSETVAVTVSDAVRKAEERKEEVILEAVQKVAEARGEQAATQAEIEEITRDTDGKRRRRRLIAMLRKTNG